MGEKSGNAIQSIRESLLRVVEHGYDQVSGDAIIIATVTETFSDALDTETFGTMTCFDNKSKIEIDEIPLNAHIGDDGNTALSGKYTFPKIGSDVYLLRDVDDAHERYICILFSHVESVVEIYNTSKTTKLIEVDTPDPDEPYETEETGNTLDETITPKKYFRGLSSDFGNVGSSVEQTPTQIKGSMGDSTGGSIVTQQKKLFTSSMGGDTGTVSDRVQTDEYIGDTISFQGDMSNVHMESDYIKSTTPEYTIDTGTATSFEPAVLGDTAVDLIGQILDAVQLITVTAAGSPSSPPINSATFAAIKLQLDTMLATNIKLK